MTEIITNTARPSYALPKASLLLGLVLFTLSNLFYAVNRYEFNEIQAPGFYSYISLLLLTAASMLFAVSAFSYLKIQHSVPATVENGSNVPQWSLGRIVSDGLFQEKKLVITATAVYAFFFALLDGILIYQPKVNFALAYDVSGFTSRVVTCCGVPGYVPVGLLYFPAQHLGVQLIPLSVMLMIFVSLLVGLNVALLYRAYSLSRSNSLDSRKGVAGSIAGAAFGLFAGCPTCAAAFFLSMIAGTGATAFSAVISAYQPVIVALTVPLLLFSIYWQARSIRTILQGCAPGVVMK